MGNRSSTHEEPSSDILLEPGRKGLEWQRRNRRAHSVIERYSLPTQIKHINET